jgi:transcriptional regulator with XRE-family HTH domain
VSTMTPYRLDWDVPDRCDPTTPGASISPTPNSWWHSWIDQPPPVTRSAPEPQRQTKEVLDWTGLSQRALAEALGTSHPTVGSLLSGQSTDLFRRPAVRRRLADVHTLCERLAPLLEHDSHQLLNLLQSRDNDGARLVDLAAQGKVARAYVLALHLLAPPTEKDFPINAFPSVPGTATVALQD